MAKLSSFKSELLALGFQEEFLSLKHLYSQSEASKLREMEVSSTVKKLATAGVGFGTGIGEEVEGLSMWVGRGVSIRVDRGNLQQVLRGGRTGRLFSSEVNSEGNGRGGKTGRLLF